jgi:hypothetical protein
MFPHTNLLVQTLQKIFTSTQNNEFALGGSGDGHPRRRLEYPWVFISCGEKLTQHIRIPQQNTCHDAHLPRSIYRLLREYPQGKACYRRSPQNERGESGSRIAARPDWVSGTAIRTAQVRDRAVAADAPARRPSRGGFFHSPARCASLGGLV